jgi:hypothetical protein
MTQIAMLAAVLVAPVLFVTATRRWELTLFAAMILMVFEGALRKWVLPEFQAYIYLLKDVLIVIALLGFLSVRGAFLSLRGERGPHEGLMTGIKVLLALNLAFAFIQLANPYSPSILLGLLGFKNYLLYCALVFMVPYAFSSIGDLERKLKVYMLLMIPVAVLGLVQFASPANSIINTYVDQYGDSDLHIARFGEDNRARASGTFSYISGFGTFVTAMFSFSLAYILAGRWDFRKNLVQTALLVTSAAAMFTTGSRAVIWGQLFITPIILFLCARGGLLSSSMVARLLFAVVVLGGITFYASGDAVDAFIQRSGNADNPVDRMEAPFTELAYAFEGTPAFGLGIGVTHGSAASIMGTRDQWWLMGNVFELETARVMTEVGIFGFILVFALRFYLLYLAIAMVTRLRTPFFRALSAVIAGFFVLHLWLNVINNATAGLYYWFAAGLLFAMFRLERETVQKHAPMTAHVSGDPRRAHV